jgi:uncharacterized protein
MSKGGAIDNVEFAKSGRHLEGRLGLAELSRAADLLLEADVGYRLTGLQGARGELLLRLRLEGTIGVRCERCLEAMRLPMAQETVFELRRDERAISADDMNDDERDFLVFDRAMPVRDLVEDELILGIPVAPKHADCELAGRTMQDDGRRQPFGVLASLKK